MLKHSKYSSVITNNKNVLSEISKGLWVFYGFFSMLDSILKNRKYYF